MRRHLFQSSYVAFLGALVRNVDAELWIDESKEHIVALRIGRCHIVLAALDAIV